MSARPASTAWRPAWLLGGVAAGTGLQLQQVALWTSDAYLGLGAAALLILAAATWAWRAGRAGAWAAAGLALALLAFASTGWRAGERLAQRLPAALEGRDLWVTGVVARLPQPGTIGTRFEFEVEQGQDADGPVRLPPRLSLGWYRNWHDEQRLADPAADLAAGQRWRLPLRLRQPHGLLNPEGFDLELYLFERELGATGYVRVAVGGQGAEKLADAVAHPVERLRQRLRDAIVREVPDARAAGVLAALAVGDQAAIDRGDWDLFRISGVAHLMSISGVHVTMFAWLAGALVGAAWRRSPRLSLAWPAPLVARWGGLAAALGYAVLAGWGVPAQRTVGMLAAAALLQSLGLRWPWLLVLGVAGTLVVLLDPWALLQPGFWLSFAAVGLLMASEPPGPAAAGTTASGWRSWVGGHLRAQAVATLGLAPLSLVFFQQVSVVGVLANLVAIPFVTLVVTPLALLGCVLPLAWAAGALAVQALVAGLSWLAAAPLAVWNVAAAPPWAVACGLLAAVVAVLPWSWRLRLLGLPLALPLLAPPVARPPDGAFELVAADVGQGTAVLVRTRHHLLVYDTGPMTSPDSDAGQRVLLPLLRARGETVVDALVLSHRDSDHTGGAASLQAGVAVHRIASSLVPGHPLLARGTAHERCDDGGRWAWDGVNFEFLHPPAEEHALPLKPNALSCVLKVTDATGRSALLTGDIEAAQEQALLARHGPRLKSEVLLVPHHGSRTSSGAAFVAAVSPQVAVVQAGYRSRFGHPATEVLQRYQAQGVALVRSDACGAWTWADGNGRCTRDERRRYWHHRPGP